MMASLEVGFKEACAVHGLGPGVLPANVLGTGQRCWRWGPMVAGLDPASAHRGASQHPRAPLLKTATQKHFQM